MKFSPEMMFEEIDILMRTGKCPRCDALLEFDVREDDWRAHCKNCKTSWGGSI